MNKTLVAVVSAFALPAVCAVAWAQGAPSAAAPAAAQPAWMQYKPVYTGEENDITNPHRTTDEMTSWAQQTAADVLSFGKDDEKAKIAGYQKYFVKQGWDLYWAYLKDSKILDMVDQQGYSVSTIVSEAPEIVNKGASGGSYHWILRMPITVSFYKKNPTGEPTQGPSGKFYLFMDVLRVLQSGAGDGIAITNWRVMEVPKN